jgi:hypothetical protein
MVTPRCYAGWRWCAKAPDLPGAGQTTSESAPVRARSVASGRELRRLRDPDQGDPALGLAVVHQLGIAPPRLEVYQLVGRNTQGVQSVGQLGNRVGLDRLPAALARPGRGAAWRPLLGSPGRGALARRAAAGWATPTAAGRRSWRPGLPSTSAASSLSAGSAAPAAATTATTAPGTTPRPPLVCHLAPPAARPRSRRSPTVVRPAGLPAPALYHTLRLPPGGEGRPPEGPLTGAAPPCASARRRAIYGPVYDGGRVQWPTSRSGAPAPAPRKS